MTVIDDKLSGKKALITGASGFIGSNLRRALLGAGVDVLAIRRKSSPEPKEGRSVVADYADVDGLTALMGEEKPDWVFHVAGATKGVTYEDFQRANVMPTRNLLLALAEAHPELARFVMVSSLAAYGPSTPARPLEETDTRRPIEFYGKSKLEAEQLLEAMGDRIPWTILRPSGVYGPGDGDYFNLFREVESGRNVFFGNRDRWFSAVYVDDCVAAILAAATSDQSLGKGYFLDDGRPVTWGQFQAAIVEASGKRVRTLNLPEALVSIAAFGGELATKFDKKPRLFNRQKAKMGAQDAWTCRSDAAQADLGFVPQVQIEEGVKRAIDWYREEGWL
ncbi:MAG: NAD-dependent epimerase/dehydratase family protein [Sandaracinaceae bacterium]